MCLQKSNHKYTAVFFGIASPTASCVVWPRRRPRCLSHGRFVCSPTVPFPLPFVFSPIFIFPPPFAPLVSWVPSFSDRGRSRTSAAVDCCGVGVGRILLSGYRGALSALTPLLPGRLPARRFLSPFRAHSHSSPAWSLSPSILLAYSFSQPSHPTRLLL